jgi:hypothetical protein
MRKQTAAAIQGGSMIVTAIPDKDRWRYKIGETTSHKTYATEALALKAGEKFKREYLPR